MFVSYVLRVRPERVREGQFAGEIEAVASGKRFAVRSVNELLAVVLETVGDETNSARSGRSEQGLDR